MDSNNHGTVKGFNEWEEPVRVGINESIDTLEVWYKETSTISSTMFSESLQEKVFKIVFSCKKGKWHKSERIYGEIYSATEESYVFPD